MAHDDGQSAASNRSSENQSNGKDAISYTYWTSCETSASTRTLTPPKKLTSEEAAAQAEAERKMNAGGASAWNHAGTFEEKNLTDWARTWLKDAIAGLKQGPVSVKDVPEVSGDANVWIVRGKKRCGFDFTITLNWKADIQLGPNLQHITGTCKVVNACCDDLDDLALEPEVTGKRPETAAEEAAALQHVAKLKPLIREKLELFSSELRSK